MAANKTKSLKGSLALSVFALSFTLMPILSMGLWTYHTFFSDQRRVVELRSVQSADSPRLFEEPLISVTFDDGWESIYSQAAPVMSKYDIASTQYILPGQFGSPIYMSAAQALSMKEAGHEISSHTYTHQKLTEASQSTVVRELDLSIQVLSKFKLLDDGHLTFAAPNGALDGYSMAQVKSRFALARNVNGDLSNGVTDVDLNVAGQTKRYDVIGYTVGQYTTIAELKEALEFAREHNAWFVPVYHQIDESREEYSVTPREFERHMKLFKDSGIKIVTMRDVLIHNQEKFL